MALTLTDWLNIAPCPPPWKPYLLYRHPVTERLTSDEQEFIARKCNLVFTKSSGLGAGKIVVIVLIVAAILLALGSVLAAIFRLKKKKNQLKDSLNDQVLHNSNSEISEYKKFDGSSNLGYNDDQSQGTKKDGDNPHQWKISYTCDKKHMNDCNPMENVEDSDTNNINNENSTQLNSTTYRNCTNEDRVVTEKAKL